jgi:hypothetical protein
MTKTFALKIVVVSTLCISLGFQAYAMLFVMQDMLTGGKVDFGAVFVYFATLPFSISTYLIGSALIYGAKIAMPVKWIHSSFFGSHLIMVICIFAFPGKFSP